MSDSNGSDRLSWAEWVPAVLVRIRDLFSRKRDLPSGTFSTPLYNWPVWQIEQWKAFYEEWDGKRREMTQQLYDAQQAKLEAERIRNDLARASYAATWDIQKSPLFSGASPDRRAAVWSSFVLEAGRPWSAGRHERLFVTPIGGHGQNFSRALTASETNVRESGRPPFAIDIEQMLVELWGAPEDRKAIRQWGAFIRDDLTGTGSGALCTIGQMGWHGVPIDKRTDACDVLSWPRWPPEHARVLRTDYLGLLFTMGHEVGVQLKEPLVMRVCLLGHRLTVEEEAKVVGKRAEDDLRRIEGVMPNGPVGYLYRGIDDLRDRIAKLEEDNATDR